MALPFKINNVSALQMFQFLRFLCFLTISIYFTKVPLSREDIGSWEMLMFISGALSYFWVTGILQSFLPLSQRSMAFVQHKRVDGKSPELFNAFVLLLAFSIAFALLILLMYGYGKSHTETPKIPYPGLLIIYFILSNTSPLIEHIFLIQDKPRQIFRYGIISTIVQILAVCVPVMSGMGLQSAIWGLIIANALRFFFLLFLLFRHAEFRLSMPFILNNLYVGYPIMFSALLSGSTQYVDSLVATIAFDARDFAIFRYGCKELPFVVMMTSGLNNALIPAFSIKKNIPRVLAEIKKKSLRQMHVLYPLSILFMFFSKMLYGQVLFNPEFNRSADVFMVYQLMIISRVVFPQTILIGLKKTRILMWAAVVEIALNIPLSLFFVQYYGVVGIALGSGLIHILEKFILMWYNYRKLGISPKTYTPLAWYVFYSTLIGIVFILIDHKIVYIP
ncbi:MAG: oligosaccharide flippase family protein [Bacteroidales bacterium]|nr:oligosaccharide flippase family protein [Bacteroidales bacterium]